MKKLFVVPLAALTLGFGFAGDIANASESHNTVPIKMKMASVDTLIDITEPTDNEGHYNDSFNVSYSRDVRIYIQNKGNVPMIVTLTNEKGKKIFQHTIKGKDHKEIAPEYFISGNYYFSIDAKGDETEFRFRAVGLD